jgi:CRISPR-associated endonuclease/helicase Cas3
MYIAHTRETDDAEQLLIDHLLETAKRAKDYAAPWGGSEFAELCGLAHDIGKYSNAFQTRIRGGVNRVDHATAGGQFLYNEYGKSTLGILMAYCVMGHHGGIPNGGSNVQANGDDSTLFSRLKRNIADYSAYREELALPRLERFSNSNQWADGFDAAFFVRMAFSALVDADWLDTEKFCKLESAQRGGFASIPELEERLKPHINNFLYSTVKKNNLNQKRNQLLNDCISAAELPPGLFSLTAPTGSGKTFASLAFALRHAVRHGKRRVIYIVPYNTIIDQCVTEFEKRLGIESVLSHVSDVDYDDEDGVSPNKRHSVENWDYPIIVTSSVQFFESLFANKPAKCRKLHNIAQSVLIFDEAQTIPIPYILPCVRAIKTLVMQYGCSAVLATATQSALDKIFMELPPGKPLPMTEISENPPAMYNALRRTRIVDTNEPIDDDDLTSRIIESERVLCIVNTRRHAQKLFKQLHKTAPDGAYHLSTTMTTLHRKETIKEIRQRLKDKLICRVIGTSMVEAGVDLDFDRVYREQAGLESVVQAAGRCNREGKRSINESIVEVFVSLDDKPPSMLKPNIDAYGQISRRYNDIADLDAIRGFFEQLFYNIGDRDLDAKEILQMLNDGAIARSFPFSEVAKAFKLIDDEAQQTIYILSNVPDLEARLYSGERSREIFRELRPYAVSLFESDVKELDALGAIMYPDKSDPNVQILFEQYYNEHVGVILSPDGGQGLIT